MFTVFQNLLPRALAWRTTVDTTLRRYFVGLAGFAGEVRTFLDLVYLDLFPGTTRELPAWEDQFTLVTDGSETTRRARVAAAWQAQGGQSPDYIETQLQLAGFAIWIHEWWESGPPYVARDPRDYTSELLLGFYQCEGSDPWECFDPGPGEALAPHCDDTLVNDPGYIVNLDLTRRAPPPVPSNPAFWPYFLYFASETFPVAAYVDADRVDELKAKILQLRPAQQWNVLMFEPLLFLSSMLYRFTIDRFVEYEAGTEDDIRRIASQTNVGMLGGDSAQATSDDRPVATTFPEGRAAFFDAGASLSSSLPASSWTALHNPTGIVTLAIRFRVPTSGTCVLLKTLSNNANSAIGMWILEVAGVMALQIGNGGAAQTETFAAAAGVTHTLVLVKDGAQIEIYVDDMATPAGSLTISAGSSASPQETLTIGSSVSNVGVWVPEVLVFDFAASEAQRERISAHLGAWLMEPSVGDYIDTMSADGLAHWFDGVDFNAMAGTWTDTMTSTNMVLDGGGSRSSTTLDGHAAFTTTAPWRFHAAGALADGTDKAFTVYTYGRVNTPGVAGFSIWEFNHSGGALDFHGWPLDVATSQVSREANGTTQSSATLALANTARHYTHVFRAANDTANNIARVDALQQLPALNCNPLASNEFRLLPHANAIIYAFLALYDRALNEGDLQALYQVIEREL